MSTSIINKTSLDPEAWVDKYGDYLFYFAKSRLNDGQLALDLVQETFLSALKSAKNFRGDSQERTWLTGILKRKIIDHYRKKKILTSLDTHSNDSSDFHESGTLSGQWKKERQPGNWDMLPMDELEKTDFRRVLTDCLSELPENQAGVFAMREMDGMSTEEICKELDVSASNLFVLLHRARLQLRRCLEINWLDEK